MTKEVHPRWTDNPFSPPFAHMSDEQRERVKKFHEAIRIFHATGDKRMAQEVGLFPTPEEEAELAAEK